MRRSAGFLAVLMFSALLFNLSSAEAKKKGDCQEALVGNSYTCRQNDEGMTGVSGAITVTFETGGLSSKFDMIYGGEDYGCSCNTTGSLESPNFNGSSSEFECLSLDSRYLLSGNVKGKKLSGQGTSEFGDDVIFTCTKD